MANARAHKDPQRFTEKSRGGRGPPTPQWPPMLVPTKRALPGFGAFGAAESKLPMAKRVCSKDPQRFSECWRPGRAAPIPPWRPVPC
jgi:hypothetical protein